MMPIENGACSLIDDERFGETAPPFCHIEKLIPVSRLDFFMRFEPFIRHQVNFFIIPH
jgi:hypothetical protein